MIRRPPSSTLSPNTPLSRSPADLVEPRLLGTEQRTSLSRRAGVQVSRAQMAFDCILSDDEPAPSPFPLPRHHAADRKGPAPVQQLPLARPGLRRRLYEHVHLPLAADAQVPGLDLVRARAVAAELGFAAPDHLQRHLAHVLLEAAAAHVPGRAAVFGDEQLRPLVPVRRAAHAHHGGERDASAGAYQLGQAVEDGSGLKPLLHGFTYAIGVRGESATSRA